MTKEVLYSAAAWNGPRSLIGRHLFVLGFLYDENRSDRPIQSTLPALSTEQAQALAELAAAWTRVTPPEDDDTRAAIAEGIAQADRGNFVDTAKVDDLFGRPWK